MILAFLSSLRLTLTLLLGLALVAVAGTLKPFPGGRYDLFYQSPWFRLLLALLALNMAVCTLKTILRNLREKRTALELLRAEQVFTVPLRYVLPGNPSLDLLEKGLSGQGYRIDRSGGVLLGRRGLAGRWGSTVVHLSVLAIMIGALGAGLGFVGTLNMYVGDRSAVYFDWDRQEDLPLGFEFRLDSFEPLYYPIELQFVAIDPETRQVIQTYTTSEGETVDLPTPGVRARVIKFIPEDEHLILGISRGGAELGAYHTFGGKKDLVNAIDPGFEIRPTAFRTPILRQLHSEVSILEKGERVQHGVIEINQPLVHRGVAIYQTAYARDEKGFWSAGFQFSRDPGEPVVWAGCILLVLGLLAAFAIPYRAVGVSRIDGETLLLALAGFRGEGGSAAFDALERGVAASLAEEEGQSPPGRI